MFQSFQVTGFIKSIGESKTFSEKYSERTFVVEYQSSADYKYDVALTLSNTRLGMIDAFVAGENVTVSFNIQSRAVKGVYYTKLNVWKVEHAR
jgi:hypothetical protein